MKKSLFALAFASLFAASCAFAAYVPGETKKLVVGTSCTYPPYEFVSPEGKPSGFDIELMEAIGAKMGVAIEWFDTGKFDSLLAAIPTGKVDCAIAGMSATKERAKRMLFSDIYEVSHSAIVTKASLSPKNDADLKGLVGSVQQGTVQETALLPIKDQFGFELKLFPKFDDCMLDMVTGRTDFSLMDIPVAHKYMAMPAFQGKIKIAYSKIITGAGKAIAMPLGSDALAADINKALAALEADGTVQTLRDKWGIKFEI